MPVTTSETRDDCDDEVDQDAAALCVDPAGGSLGRGNRDEVGLVIIVCGWFFASAARCYRNSTATPRACYPFA